MSDEIINELVNELYKDELAMINSAISKLKLKNDEFKKECIKLDEAAQKLNHAKKELSKEHQKLNKQFGIEKEEIKEEIEELSEEWIMALTLVDKCEKEYEIVKKNCEKVKQERKEIECQRELIEQEHERLMNMRLKKGLEQISEIKDLTPQAKEIINGLIN